MQLKIKVNELLDNELIDISGLDSNGNGYNIIKKNQNVILLATNPKDSGNFNKICYIPNSSNYISNDRRGVYNFLKLYQYNDNEISKYLDNLKDTDSFRGFQSRSLSPKPYKKHERISRSPTKTLNRNTTKTLNRKKNKYEDDDIYLSDDER